MKRLLKYQKVSWVPGYGWLPEQPSETDRPAIADMSISVSASEKMQEKAESILAALGIPVSNAINMFYKQIILQRGIFAYIAYELQSDQNAAAQLARLEENICALDRMPERYLRYEKEPWYSRGQRVMPVDHYCVFYTPDHDRKIVNITRVLYGGRDIGTVLADSETV